MYRVLLVEDEEIIRKGLIQNVPWAQYGFSVVADAEDGDEAWRLYQEMKPDAIITDIKMPETSGLDLLKRIKADNPEAFVLLLSGYEEFEYARTGLKHGAFEYISKLSVMEEIDKILSRLAAEIEARRRQAASIKKKEEESGGHILELMIRGEMPEGLLKNVPFVSMIAICGQMHVLPALPEHVILLARDNLTLVVSCLLARTDGDSLGLMRQMGEAPDACGISGVYPAGRALDCLYAALKDLDEKMLLRFYPPPTSPLDISFEDAIILERHEALPRIFEEDAYRSILDKDTDLVRFRVFCRRCVEALYQYGFQSPNGARVEDISITLSRFFSMVDIRQWVLGQIDQFCAQRILQQRARHLDDMAKALLYIDAHFQEDIDASDVARALYLTPQHFSSKFKMKVGEGFASYLRRKRLETACLLLEKTDKTIADVGASVGYEDTKYFYRVFKKAFAVSPNAYRRQMQKQKEV